MAAISSNWKLPEELAALSVCKSWPKVLEEWSLNYVEILEGEEDMETCLCHHHPIREVCHIVNSKNGNSSIVGNCCIKKFEDLEPVFAGTHKVFDSLKKIKKDPESSANRELIEYAFSKGALDERDRQFYLDIWKKRGLTDRQLRWKSSLNQRIIRNLTGHRGGPIARVQTSAERTLQQSLDYLRRNPASLVDRLLVRDAFDKGLISVKDRNFYYDIFERHTRYLSERQQAWISDINDRILMS